jgi:RNA polymerase sigma-70 factor (ECF subfamily)
MTEINTLTSTFPVTSAVPDELLSRCLSGEESAYLSVYNEYAATIYRLCYSLLQHQEDAEEVLQDTFEYAFRKLHKYDARKAGFKTWLYQIAVSRCRNKRRRKWLPTFSINEQVREEVADHVSPTPAEMLAMTERQQMVWNALQELTPKLRETAVLRYYEGLTYNEIGRILDIPPKTAESRMRLAHRALREVLVGEMGD